MAPLRNRAAERAAGLRRAWVVALTANADEAQRRECYAAEFDDFLSKPFHPEAMRGALARYAARQAGGDGGAATGEGPPQRAPSWRAAMEAIMAARRAIEAAAGANEAAEPPATDTVA